MSRAIRTTAFVGALALLATAGPVPSGPGTVDAADVPASFARVARAALATSIVVRAPDYVGDHLLDPPGASGSVIVWVKVSTT